MKIRSVELTESVDHDRPVQRLVLQSDSGYTGMGEVAGTPSMRSAVVLADLLVGRDPFDVEALLADSKSFADGTILDVTLVSAATSAMSDLAGQNLGIPVHQLYGGRVRDEIRVCAVGWAEQVTDYAELADAARRTVASGFSVLRVEPFATSYVDRAIDLLRAIDLVRVVREAVPGDVDLVVAADGGLSVGAAVEFAGALRSLEPIWLEEPVPASPFGPLQRVSERVTVPLAAGRGARPDVLRQLVNRNLVDYLVLEVGRVGGLVEARRLAAHAEVYHIGVVPVGSGGSLSLSAALHLAAVVPNLSLVELRPGLVVVEGGTIPVDLRPGLGFGREPAASGEM